MNEFMKKGTALLFDGKPMPVRNVNIERLFGFQ